MNKAVFLDRDGTINEEVGYINHASRFKIFSYVFDSIRILNELSFKVIVITNQSGLARGYFDEQLLGQLHRELLEQAEKNKARIDKIYFCPHHQDGVVKKYKKNCDCRKPKPGMLFKARDEFDISLEESYLIGDRYKDICFAHNNNVRAILVKTGYGLGEYTHQSQSWSVKPDFICENLLEAAQLIKEIETS
jgi:D-glycero-D-manno-heptose 1,7-bisphosphate phosphatase